MVLPRKISPRDLISGNDCGGTSLEFDLGPIKWGLGKIPTMGSFMTTGTRPRSAELAAQPIGRGIVPKGVSLPAELFVQLRQITMRLKKIGSMFEGFLISEIAALFFC